MMHDGGWWWMGTGSLVFVVLLALTVWVLARQGRRTLDDWGPAERRAADVLAERFAKGEIDEREYRSRIDALRR